MADKIVIQDTTKPGVFKVTGPTVTAGNQITLASLDPTGAVNGQGIILAGGVWTPGNPASADTASNLGAGLGVFKSKVAADFQFKSLIAGTNITITNNANDLTLNSSSPFSASFTSADQVITSAGALTLAHGLGSAPTLVQLRLKAVNAVIGYSIGDQVVISPDTQDTAAPSGTSVVPDATNVNIRFGAGASVYKVMGKADGAAYSVTNADWRLVVLAWK